AMKPIHITRKQLLISLAILSGVIVLTVCGTLWYLIATAPDLDAISLSPSESATYICDSDGNYIRRLTFATSNRDLVTLDEIPEALQQAIVAIEDERFYSHHGIDVHGILRAFFKGITSGSFSEGASTITQQLIKNQVFTEWTSERTLLDRMRRKVQEQYLAVQLEKRSSKEEILENYLNTINLGAGCYGVQSAAKRYFGKDVSDLTLSECAVLAAIPQNPSGYNPVSFPEANRRRQLIVLNYMETQGYISHDAHREAENDPVYDRILASDPVSGWENVYSYYEDALITQVTDILMQELHYAQEQAHRAIFGGGLRIYSAQDAALQTICEEEFSNPANFPASAGEELQASLVLMDQHTGLVRALVGGHGEKQASLTLNRATDTLRQPGSTFKILTAYAPALDAAGETLATLYENTPFSYEDGTPVGNWDSTDTSAAVTIREAITRSVNLAAVRCITAITPALGLQYAQNLGITTLRAASDCIQPLALGGITDGVTNLELTGAFATIADGGIYRTPKFFTKILNRSGEVLYAFSDLEEISTSADELPDDFRTRTLAKRDNTRVLKDSTAFLLTSAMQGVVSDPSGTAYQSVSASNQPVAGKTGTTSDYKDIWFVGFTPYYTCGVWGGYDSNKELPDGCHSYQKTLFSAVMNRIHATLLASEFTPPSSIQQVRLCKESHLRAIEGGCRDTYTEYFAVGTAPEKDCPLHIPIPETEPIVIYPDILDQLLPEAPDTESASEASESSSETETAPPDTEMPPYETESDSESESGSESEQYTLDTNSLQDLMNRLGT
ncbi:MAG: transglycosylase domain-containing protein, partial [Lachnospiraceae bacterium]|nr:transglycosylase domain-containing protein [Lachnospiraceae bacterium]